MYIFSLKTKQNETLIHVSNAMNIVLYFESIVFQGIYLFLYNY